jgi:hypothetical protein
MSDDVYSESLIATYHFCTGYPLHKVPHRHDAPSDFGWLQLHHPGSLQPNNIARVPEIEGDDEDSGDIYRGVFVVEMGMSS